MKNLESKFTFENVVFVGPEYRDHRGGIGAVISSYSSVIRNFNFIPTYNGKFGKIANFFLFISSVMKLFYQFITNDKVKIIHIHSASNGSFYRKFLYFFISSKIFNKKVVFHLHGAKFHLFYENSNFLIKKLIKYLCKNVDVFICLSEYWRDFLNNNFEIKRLFVLNNPVERRNFLTKQNNQKLELLFLGLISERKGIFDLINVVIDNKDIWKDKIFLTIGGNGQTEKLLNIINENGLSSFVNFVGWVDGVLKEKLLSECDVLILPSYNEGLPIAILEAMSNGKPIISTKVGGIPEVVIDNYNGFIIEPGNLEQMFNSINKFLENNELINKLGNNSLIIVDPFYVENVVSDLIKIYNFSDEEKLS